MVIAIILQKLVTEKEKLAKAINGNIQMSNNQASYKGSICAICKGNSTGVERSLENYWYQRWYGDRHLTFAPGQAGIKLPEQMVLPPETCESQISGNSSEVYHCTGGLCLPFFIMWLLVHGSLWHCKQEIDTLTSTQIVSYKNFQYNILVKIRNSSIAELAYAIG